MLQEVARGGGPPAEIVTQMGDLIDGYIELAAMEFGKDASVVAFPAGLRRAKRYVEGGVSGLLGVGLLGLLGVGLLR